MSITIRKLHKANVYLNGSNFAGIASEVTLPEVTPMTKEHAPTCMDGKISLPYGMNEMKLVLKGDFDEAFVLAASSYHRIKERS